MSTVCDKSIDGRMCDSDDGEPCAQCKAWWQAEYDYWRPLFEGEKAAGLIGTPEEIEERLRAAGRLP